MFVLEHGHGGRGTEDAAHFGRTVLALARVGGQESGRQVRRCIYLQRKKMARVVLLGSIRNIIQYCD